VKTLLEIGANWEKSDCRGFTAIDTASEKCEDSVVDLIKKYATLRKHEI
jgi:hypothetical protein